MSKSSVVTVRETPVAKTTSASAGGFAVVAETIEVDTTERIELVDLTDTVMAFVRRSGVQEGLLSLWSMHTTCTVFINESQEALEADIKAFLEDVVARGEVLPATTIPTHSDCDRQNADSHLRAMLLGPLGDDADQRRRAGGRALAARVVRRDGWPADAHDSRTSHGIGS